ncbi:AsmA-like C-terminal region-containing protein [Aeromonas caviae]|uniref:AsmA-like C-terminal region-containing protein n=1 Tax=Aeromonas caviae TaxID=648 RepID=A0AAE9PJ10_AERCA|nr:AsmA-like C-terminal region-containing protein [Aeromonas caviae]MCU7793269.1 AsmA-like C-terminal region-containing protein [Aeromonas caviae]MDH1635012.1 AsmA-like C-terminal region-containing protein [Aeromonas caviae]MDX7766640.1 AsmA-like C-terminal region-containing protein [Aeromonas caviae]RQM51392.1 membrane assembly protein AsmA [Aeromonas caviae]UZC85022.2 AsmA-like C-terminal region-containing protein [Aeromonas caviae]
MNSWLRGLLYTFAFLLLFVWVGLGLFDAERAKGPIANWLSQQTGVPVTIGRLVFNPLHPYTLLAEQVRYGDAVQLEKLYLEIEHIDWLNRDVRIAHLDLIRPVIKLPLPNQLPSLPVHSLTISDSTIDNLSLQSEALTLRGLSASLSDWELIDPRRQPQANLTLGINQLETPMFTLARLSLKGRLEGQVLSTDRLTTNLFDGLLETGMVLNWPERSLQLHDLKARAMRLELGDIPPGEFPLRRITLDRGQLAQVSINAIDQELSLNNFNGQLTAFDWQTGSQPSGYLAGTLGDMGRGLFQLEAVEGKLAFSPRQLDAELRGKAYEGEFNVELALDTQQQKLVLKDLALSGMDISLPQGWWQDWQGWRPQQIDIRKLAFDKLKVLSFDDTLPLSLTGWQLYLNDLALWGNQPGPLLGRARIESKWFELVWDGLSARNGTLDGELTPSSWQLNTLATSLPDEGSLNLSGQWGRTPGQESRLQLQGKQLDLEQWGKLLHSPVSFAGKVDLAADLQADLNGQPGEQTANWRRTLQGSLSLESKDPFWDKVGIDPLLDDWFREQTPPDLTPQTLWQAMQRGDTPFYQIRLDARAEQGKVRIEQGGASTITHLLALQGGVDLAADQWQLDLGVLNKGRCAELLARWRGPLNAPDLGWSFPTGQDACGWEAGVHYPAQGRSGPLWRPRPPAAQ